jgi:hypothetical protein
MNRSSEQASRQKSRSVADSWGFAIVVPLFLLFLLGFWVYQEFFYDNTNCEKHPSSYYCIQERAKQGPQLIATYQDVSVAHRLYLREEGLVLVTQGRGQDTSTEQVLNQSAATR